MLPSILFFLAVYALYALVLAWCSRQRFHFRDKAAPRPRWVVLARGAVALGLILALVFWLKPDTDLPQPRLAGILGLSPGEELPARGSLSPVAEIPLKEPEGKGQPVYALLHPESPPTLLPPQKLPVATRARKGQEHLPPKIGMKTPKTASPGKSREKTSGKPKGKKKKVSGLPANPGGGPSEPKG